MQLAAAPVKQLSERIDQSEAKVECALPLSVGPPSVGPPLKLNKGASKVGTGFSVNNNVSVTYARTSPSPPDG